MAVTDHAAWKAMRAAAPQRIAFTKNSFTLLAGRRTSLWTLAPLGGAAPTTAAVPTRATLGALDGFVNGGSNPLRVVEAEAGCRFATGGVLTLCDRLSHQGGLSAIVTGAQTTNLPTAALTRQTSGEGVKLGLEIYTIIGTTGTTITCSYTNQAGTAGQVTQPIVFGATNNREAGLLLPVPLAAGDSGVRAVANVNLVASTVTAGNFGVTLYRELLRVPLYGLGQYAQFDPLLDWGACPEIEDDACLFWMMTGTGTTGEIVGSLSFAEDQ